MTHDDTIPLHRPTCILQTESTDLAISYSTVVLDSVYFYG